MREEPRAPVSRRVQERLGDERMSATETQPSPAQNKEGPATMSATSASPPAPSAPAPKAEEAPAAAPSADEAPASAPKVDTSGPEPAPKKAEESSGSKPRGADEGPATASKEADDARPAPALKKVSKLDINQRFFQSAQAVTATKPAAAPAVQHEDTRAHSSPRLVTAMPGKAPPSHAAPSATAEAARRDAPRESSATRVPWGNVKPTATRVHVSTQDFPTAKEVMDAERRSEERAAAQAAEEAERQRAHARELDRFRGIEVPSSHQWDAMDSDSDESLDDVVEFGDGKQYKISEVEQERAKQAPKGRPARNPFGAAAQTAAASDPPATPAWTRPLARRTAPAAPPAPAPVPAPATSWGPLAQRHSMLTGKPPPAAAQPRAPDTPAADAHQAQATPASAKDISEEQHSEMHTAAERARKRREEDERAREAERERARQRAAQIEEQIREAERAKREARERELAAKREARERELAAKREARERELAAKRERDSERERQRLEERDRKDRAAMEKAATKADTMAQEPPKPDVEELDTWRRTTPLPKSLRTPKPAPAAEKPPKSTETVAESRVPHNVSPKWNEAPIPPESPLSCDVWADEEAPVWRQYRVCLPRRQHVVRLPTRAAQRPTVSPRISATFASSWSAPWGQLGLGETEAAYIAPRAKPRVHLRADAARGAGTPGAGPSVPRNDAQVVRALTEHVDAAPSAVLFAEELSTGSGAPRRRRAPQVKLPGPSATNRALPLLGVPYGNLFQRPLGGMGLHDVPREAAPRRGGPWGASPLALPLLPHGPEQSDAVPFSTMWQAPSAPGMRRGRPDEALAPTLPVSLGEWPRGVTSKLDVLASPFQPGHPPASSLQASESPSWSFRRRQVAPAEYYGPPNLYGGRTAPPNAAPPASAPRQGEEPRGSDPYVLPADYSDFMLSDSW